MREFLLAQHILGQRRLLFLERADFFLDALLDEQAVGVDFLGLANAMGAVNGLALDRRIPSGIEHEVR